MVNGKMCVSVGNEEMMCRIDPNEFETALENPGCRPMVHGGRTMKGFVFVNEESIRGKKEFNYWINLTLDFNKKAKAAPKKKTSTENKKVLNPDYFPDLPAFAKNPTPFGAGKNNHGN